MVKSLFIHGLRGFGEARVIEFSIPNGQMGSGITFIVGGNNSGKTTILEALRAFNCYTHNKPSFSERKRNKKCEQGKVHLKMTAEDDNCYSIDTADKGGSPTTLKINGETVEGEWQPPTVFALQSRRFVEYEFYRNDMNRFDYIRNQQGNYYNRSAVLSEFNVRLFNMYEHKEDFDPILRLVLGYNLDWTIEQNENGSYYLKLILGGYEHSSEGLGDGIWSIFTICDALYDSKAGDTIAIDEPELSLHPAYQKKMMELINKYAKDRQIIISTHSPYFIDLSAIVNGAYLYRTVKNTNGDIDVFSLSTESRKNLKGFLGDINQPHTFGIEAKEIFFLEDKVILVEGQEDVMMYTLASESVQIPLCGNFFGWGAGGAPKIPKVLKVLQDLGYSKVAVIFDGDKKRDKEELSQKYPQYSFFIITTDDVRDKKEIVNKPAKSGLMNSKGEVKEEHKDEIRMLFENINKSLNE